MGTSFALLDGKPLPALAKGAVEEIVLAQEWAQEETVRANRF
jgi:hypothetical protein